MLVDLLGAVGVATFGYLVYGVCRVDRKMCKLGVVGVALILLTYVSRYVDIDSRVLAFVLLVAVAVVAAVLAGRL
jgi:hypothetical protein